MITNFKTAAAIIFVVVFLMSCAIIPERFPSDVPGEDKNRIVDSYAQAWLEKDTYPYDRQLVQLGIPSPKSVVLWYVLDKRDLQQVVQPRVELCQEESGDRECVYRIYDDVQHVHLSEYGTGRIEVLGLKPDQEYLGRVILLDKAIEFRARTAPEPGDQKPFSFLAYSGFQPYAWKEWERPPYINRQTVRILDMLKERAQANIDSDNKG